MLEMIEGPSDFYLYYNLLGVSKLFKVLFIIYMQFIFL